MKVGFWETIVLREHFLLGRISDRCPLCKSNNPTLANVLKRNRYLRDNLLSGTVPFWQNLTALLNADLSLNGLCGNLPDPSPNGANINLLGQTFNCTVLPLK